MKKHYLFALMVALFAALSVTMLSSCGDDEDKSDVEEPENTDDSTGSDEESVSIIGTWKAVSNDIWTNDNGKEEHKTIDYSNGDYEIITFKEDGTLVREYVSDGRKGEATGEYTLDDSNVLEFTLHYDEKNSATFVSVITIKDDTLTMTVDTELGTYSFKEVSVYKKQQ